MLLVVPKPDVYRAGDTYVVFGEAKLEDLSQHAQLAAAERFKAGVADKPKAPSDSDDDSAVAAPSASVSEADVDLVMTQAGVSRSRAVRALADNEFDVVNAIMALTL